MTLFSFEFKTPICALKQFVIEVQAAVFIKLYCRTFKSLRNSRQECPYLIDLIVNVEAGHVLPIALDDVCQKRLFLTIFDWKLNVVLL